MKYFAILILGFTLIASSCNWDCDIAGNPYEPLSNSNNVVSTSSATYPTSCTGISPANSSNSFDEVGEFHNAFLDYVDVASFTFADMDSLIDHVLVEMVEFAMAQRTNYDFLPDDSTQCAEGLASYIANNSNVHSIDFFEECDPQIVAPSGVSSGFEDYIDTIALIYADLDADNIGLSTFITEVKDWEDSVMNSALITSEKNQLLKMGSISRHSMYYWGCNEDALTRAPFWRWLKDNWLLVGAFDLAGGLCCGGVIGAAVSSGLAAGVMWSMGWP